MTMMANWDGDLPTPRKRATEHSLTIQYMPEFVFRGIVLKITKSYVEVANEWEWHVE